MNIRDCSVINVTSQGQQIATISTAVVTSDAIDVGNFVEAMAVINVSAKTGSTPTLDCKIQYSSDYLPPNVSDANPNGFAGTWEDSGDTFTQIITTGGYFKKLSAIFGKYIRLVYTPGGTTPVFTVNPDLVVKS